MRSAFLKQTNKKLKDKWHAAEVCVIPKSPCETSDFSRQVKSFSGQLVTLCRA